MRSTQLVIINKDTKEVSIKELENKSAEEIVNTLNGVSLPQTENTSKIVSSWFQSVLEVCK